MSRKIAVISLALSLIVLATGCRQAAEKAMEKAAEKAVEKETGGKVKVRSSKGSVEIKGEKGTIRIGSQGLPDNFPKDVPVYKNAKVMGTQSGAVEGQAFSTLSLTTGDELDGVAEYYKKGLAANGWTEKSVLTGGDGGSRFATVGYEKGDRMVSVTITRIDNDKETQLVISVVPKP